MAVKGLHLHGSRASRSDSNSNGLVTSPPAPNHKKDLSSWWSTFKNRKSSKKDEEPKIVEPAKSKIFGVPLNESIRYANVAISLPDDHGGTYIYGYVPIVIAKCGVYLKQEALETEGIFRLNGSEKRIKELKQIFDTPDRYGKGLDWTGFNVHDASNVLRRYLRDLPEPIIPLEFYERFRDPLREIEQRSKREGEGMPLEISREDEAHAVKIYQSLITHLPPLNRQLLLYLLDLLAVFAAKAEINLMTAANLAAIFQPGMLSHPTHDMAPQEYRLSQDVVIFLIDTQDHFLIGMTGTAADDKTKDDMAKAAKEPAQPAQQPITEEAPHPIDVAPGAADVKRVGGLRRNVSVSTKHSSPGSSQPSSPAPQSHSPIPFGSGGVARSNTVPSKRSSAASTARHRFSRSPAPPTPKPVVDSKAPEFPVPAKETEQASSPDFSVMPTQETAQMPSFIPANVDTFVPTPSEAPAQTEQPATTERAIENVTTTPVAAPTSIPQAAPATSVDQPTPTAATPISASAITASSPRQTPTDMQIDNLEPPPVHVFGQAPAKGTSTPPGEKRGLSSFFSRSPTSDAERAEKRETNKLRKKKKKDSRLDGAAEMSAQSSASSIALDNSRPVTEGRLE